MFGDVGDACRLTSGVGGEAGGPAQWTGSAHGLPASGSGLHHAQLAPHPGADRLGRVAWPGVTRGLPLEEVQHVLGATGGPQGQVLVVHLGERPASPDRHQTRVTDQGQDHASSVPVDRRGVQVAVAREAPGCLGRRRDVISVPARKAAPCYEDGVWSRGAMVVGGLAALLITPPFALSYYSAYGMPGESPAPWLAALRDPLNEAGLLGVSPVLSYDRYGVLYLAAWLLALGGFAGQVHRRWERSSRQLRRAWTAVLASLGLVALGIAGDYAVPDDIDGGLGFLVTNVGLLGVMAAFAFLGWALRAEHHDRRVTAWCVGLLGLWAAVGGLLLVGHIPSGPGAGLALASLVTAACGRTGDMGHTPQEEATARPG